MRTFAYGRLLAACVFLAQHAESANMNGIATIRPDENICYQARSEDRPTEGQNSRKATDFDLLTTEKSESPFNWSLDAKKGACDRHLPLYLNIPTTGGGGNSKKCALNEVSSIKPIGCFPWDEADRTPNETFDNVPDFVDLIKNRGGQSIVLSDPSPEKCERLCGSYKYFGLRYDKNSNDESAICWCTSAEAMRRVVDAFQNASKERILASCSMQCSACKAQPKEVHTLCGSRTHTVVYQRTINRMMVMLDMSASMNQVAGITGVPCHPGAPCVQSFKLDWGKKVLKCVLEKKQRITGGTSVHRIATRADSGQLFGNRPFTTENVNRQWNGYAYGTFLWEYFYGQLKTMDASKVNHGQLEVVFFSDGMDNASKPFFRGVDGFRNMVDALAKQVPPIFPRFRIVCLDGGARGCAGYEQFALRTGGSFANFISTESTSYNDQELQKFCGEATAAFTDPMTCARANFKCGQNFHRKIDGECGGSEIKDCTAESCCEPTVKRSCDATDCTDGHVLKSSAPECNSSENASFSSKCSRTVCCDPPPCTANVCSDAFALKNPVPKCSNLSGSTPCTNELCCAAVASGGSGSKPNGGDGDGSKPNGGDGDGSKPNGGDGEGAGLNPEDNDDAETNLLLPLLIAAAALLLCCLLCVCFAIKKKKKKSEAELEQEYAGIDSSNPQDGFAGGNGVHGLAPPSALVAARASREQPKEPSQANAPRTSVDVGGVNESPRQSKQTTRESTLPCNDGERENVDGTKALPRVEGRKTAKTGGTNSQFLAPTSESRAPSASRRSKQPRGAKRSTKYAANA